MVPGRYVLAGVVTAQHRPTLEAIAQHRVEEDEKFAHAMPLGTGIDIGSALAEAGDPVLRADPERWAQVVEAWLAKDAASAGMRHSATPATLGAAVRIGTMLTIAANLAADEIEPGSVRAAAWSDDEETPPGHIDLVIDRGDGVLLRLPLPSVAVGFEDAIATVLGCPFSVMEDDAAAVPQPPSTPDATPAARTLDVAVDPAPPARNRRSLH